MNIFLRLFNSDNLCNKVKNSGKHNQIVEIERLLDYHDEDFINICYKILLRRNPDSTGFPYYLDLVRSGVSRTEIVIQMTSGNEGKNQNVQIYGLKKAKLILILQNLPVIGNLIIIFLLMFNARSIIKDMRAFQNYIYRFSMSQTD